MIELYPVACIECGKRMKFIKGKSTASSIKMHCDNCNVDGVIFTESIPIPDKK